MTQPPPPVPPGPDDLASAIVDGLLPPEEAAAARRDPAVARRVEDILRVRAAVRTTPPAPPAAADRAVAAAFAAFAAFDTEAHAASHRSGQHLRVVARPSGSSASDPSPPRRRRALPAAWLAAAAVILVLGGLVAAGLANQGDDDTDRTAQATAEANEGSGSGGEAADEEAPTAASEPEGDSSMEEGSSAGGATEVSVPHLGSVADAGELEDRVGANLDVGEDAATRSSEGFNAPGPPDAATGDACPGLSSNGDPARGQQTFVADAELDGQFVRAHLYDDGSGLRLVATNESCADVVDVPYDG